LASWKEHGIDINNDGKIELDLPEIVTELIKKDILVEINYMENHKPNAYLFML
jgi:hypothetical protein